MCRHGHTITTITAGLARVVCESCGHVSVRYVENSVQMYPVMQRRYLPHPEAPPSPVETGVGIRRCGLCTQEATFLIPEGMVCGEHAWQAAARISWEDGEIWVPIRIDRSNA